MTLPSLYTSQVLFGAYFLVLLCNLLVILVTENTHSGSASYIEPEALLRSTLLFWSLRRHLSLVLAGGSLYPRQLANFSRHLERLLKSLEKCMELSKFQPLRVTAEAELGTAAGLHLAPSALGGRNA